MAAKQNRRDPMANMTLEERRAAQEEGIWQTLPGGVKVLMRPVKPDALIRSGKIPDILTPIMLNAIYEPSSVKINAAVDEFVETPREQREEILEMLASIDAVCEAALIDAEQLPYLTYSERTCIFRLAFLPVEVLSRFRLQPDRDVEVAADGKGNGDTAQRATGRERRARRVPA